MSLSSQIIQERKKKGLTQEELAALTNVTVRTIQRIESGDSKPRSFTLKAIAAALQIPLETLTVEEKAAVEAAPVLSPPAKDDEEERASARHFLQVLCLSCFSYLVIPYVHFLIPARLLKKSGKQSSAVGELARKIIRGQIGWVIMFHLLLLLTLAYNMVQARYGNRQYLVNYLWIVLGMYLLNILLIGQGLRQSKRLAATQNFS